jgi:hypothetical protein
MAPALTDTPLLASFVADVLGGRLSAHGWLEAQLGDAVPGDIYAGLTRRGLVTDALEVALHARAEWGLTWNTFEERLVRASPAWAALPTAARQRTRVDWEASRRGMHYAGDKWSQADIADELLRRLLRAARRLVPAQRIHSEGVRRRRPRPRTLVLREFMVSDLAAGRSWRQKMALWNARYPAWRYTNARTFFAHCRRARGEVS